MTILNGDFELGTVAVPSGWVVDIVSAEEEWGEFAGNPSEATARAQEDFEKGWALSGDLVFKGAFEGPTIDLGLATFTSGPGQSPIETFERGWASGEIFIRALQTAELSVFNSTSDPMSPAEVEAFGFWGPGNKTSGPFSLEESGSVAATFGSETAESFEAGWGNDDFSGELDDFGLGIFGVDEDGAESFEHVAVPEEVLANSTTDEFNLVNAPLMPLVYGDPVRFETTGTLPSPLKTEVTYYLTSIDGGVFMVTTSPGGTGVPLDNEGVGKHYLCRDPAEWWTHILSV